MKTDSFIKSTCNVDMSESDKQALTSDFVFKLDLGFGAKAYRSVRPSGEPYYWVVAGEKRSPDISFDQMYDLSLAVI